MEDAFLRTECVSSTSREFTLIVLNTQVELAGEFTMTAKSVEDARAKFAETRAPYQHLLSVFPVIAEIPSRPGGD